MANETAMELLRNQVNDLINQMRRMTEDHSDPNAALNHPEIKEMAHRLHVQAMHMREFTGGDKTEPAPGVQAAPVTNETPEEILSSPYPGMEPRHVVQHRDGQRVQPDPIEKAAPTPPSEQAGKTDADDVELMAPAEPPKAAAEPAKSEPVKDSKKK